MSKDSFLERWSRRKLSGGKPDEPGPEPEHAAVPVAEPVTDAPVEETLDEAELAKLPSLDSFTLKTDLAPFLRKGVPHALKNAAMRKMWMLDPAIRDHKDLAVDYAWDWNTPGGVPGNSGTISRESVTRMLESLNPKPEEPATAQSEPSEDPPGAAAEPGPGAPDGGEATASAEPEAQAQVPQQEAGNRVSDAPEAARARDGMARPRRHGGAAPA